MVSGVKIKVCGMVEAENIRDVAALHPDYMGFIFYDKSPRYVGTDFIAPNDIDASLNRVGVFVNQSESFIKNAVNKHQLQYVQLHGDESVGFCEALRLEGIRVIKVFRVDEGFDFTSTRSFESVSDFFLFDTKGKLYGGNSTPFNWELLKRYNQAVPFFLSGGIQSGHINALKNFTDLNIHAIDINSGVEDKPGFKNIHKISAIINQLSI